MCRLKLNTASVLAGLKFTLEILLCVKYVSQIYRICLVLVVVPVLEQY